MLQPETWLHYTTALQTVSYEIRHLKSYEGPLFTMHQVFGWLLTGRGSQSRCLFSWKQVHGVLDYCILERNRDEKYAAAHRESAMENTWLPSHEQTVKPRSELHSVLVAVAAVDSLRRPLDRTDDEVFIRSTEKAYATFGVFRLGTRLLYSLLSFVLVLVLLLSIQKNSRPSSGTTHTYIITFVNDTLPRNTFDNDI